MIKSLTSRVFLLIKLINLAPPPKKKGKTCVEQHVIFHKVVCRWLQLSSSRRSKNIAIEFDLLNLIKLASNNTYFTEWLEGGCNFDVPGGDKTTPLNFDLYVEPVFKVNALINIKNKFDSYTIWRDFGSGSRCFLFRTFRKLDPNPSFFQPDQL